MIAEKIAKILIESDAVRLSPQDPFTYTSGLKGPIYTDNRLLISFVEERNAIVDALINLVKERGLKPDCLAGTATAGIPWAAFMAERMGLPMVYVRSKPKEHGAGKQIEGKLPEGKSVLIVEDLVTTGGSAINSVNAIRDEGKGIVHEVFAIFSYGLEKAENAFRESSTALTTLTNLDVLLDVALQMGKITDEDKAKVMKFKTDPVGWMN
ncbi:orotate phosphoribosyltransferase [Patescibacteria group bacterium]|nr:orotate phosphoribosyltransferase [Patescibacteria group bacterium]